MKILFDAVYTNRPSVCSTSYLVWQLIKDLSKWREDVFFYVLYPENRMEEADWEFMKQSDRVTLLPVPAFTADRMTELFLFREELRRYMVPFNRECWDFDVVVSSRIPMLSSFYPHFAREGGTHMRSLRAVIGLEEMPLLPHRQTVAWSDQLYMRTLESYSESDGVLVNNRWTLDPLRKVAREVYSPAMQKKLLSNLHEVLPVKVQRLGRKTDAQMYKEGDFNVTFVGRITGTRNFMQVVDLFRKKFIYAVGKKKNLKFLVSTNSQSLGASDYGDIEFMDMQYNNREEFHRFLEEAHVSVNLTEVEDFSLATYETLMRGVPIVVLDKPWNSFLGPDYPFRVSSQVEAHALLNSMLEDYPAQYARFVEWEETYWKSFVEGPENTTTSEKLIDMLTAFEAHRLEVIEGRQLGGGMRTELAMLMAAKGDVLDLTAFHDSHIGRFKDGDTLTKQSNTISRQCNTLLLKVLAHGQGYKDTKEVGVVAK